MGATWNVEPAHDLDIPASLECAVTGVVKNDRPSGGSVVTLKGPVGFAVSFIHGQKPAPELPCTTQDRLKFMHIDEGKEYSDHHV
jgi:hypothetical protein